MNSKSSTFDIYLATLLYQPNADGDTASLYQFSNPFLAISPDNTQFAELGASTFQQCSGNNRIKLCRKDFSTTTDETLLCLASLFIIMMFRLFAIVKSNLFCYLMPHKLFILQMECIM